MNDFSKPSKMILDFLTLLEVEQAKETSDLFNAAIWQDLNQLNLDLDAITHPNKIASKILSWCKKHTKIDQEFRAKDWSKIRDNNSKVRGDMVGEDDIDIPLAPAHNEAEIIRNRDKIQKVIQDNQQPENQDLPNNTPEQD
ncbi:hypothetical protein [Tychonema sp. BBK16]|uniref:hypothetical protein n=1 Tax=Tychonema sp. BBK16 TaxID=2699888 RepID=UPI001F2226C6|nr:hypothetical protein [Tychonema sp. BBK16]MCF6375598.1 hypothetical protein [Tychonema sp. BBK16]